MTEYISFSPIINMVNRDFSNIEVSYTGECLVGESHIGEIRVSRVQIAVEADS
jgi:hypothetical protein